MKKMTVEELAEHVQGGLVEAQNEHIMVLRDGRPIAVLLGIEHKDEEDWRLEVSPEFWREIEAVRKQPTVPWDDVKASLFQEDEVRKFQGTISWWGRNDKGNDTMFEAVIPRCLLRSHRELVMDCEQGGWMYSVKIHNVDGSRFEGKFDARKEGKVESVTATATLYENENGCLLSGTWNETSNESRYQYKWWVELVQVERFADEAAGDEVNGALKSRKLPGELKDPPQKAANEKRLPARTRGRKPISKDR